MNLYFIGTHADANYIPYLKPILAGHKTFLFVDTVQTWIQISILCKQKGITGIISTSPSLLSKLLQLDGSKQPSINDYAGSLFKRDGIEIVFINPLDHFVKVPYAKFIATRYISKVIDSKNWFKASFFNWTLGTQANLDKLYYEFSKATAIAEDIETNDSLHIRCVGYTAIYIDGTSPSGFKTTSIVIPADSEFALAWIRKFNLLSIPKIFQNGKYDNAYLSMYRAPVSHWLWDTMTMFHCWYAELPKDLAYINAFFVRESMYWKDMAKTTDLHQYYEYNARDHWATANVFIAWILQSPAFAKQNYLMEFPVNFPCHLCEMTGLKRDMDRLKEVRAEAIAKKDEIYGQLRRELGVPNFNTNSSPQMKKLFKVLGCSDLPSQDEKNIDKAKVRHPLNYRILSKVVSIREQRKLISTYLRTDDDITKTSKRGGKEYRGRILYALNPHGTDTGRLASRESHFWCGLQIQNIPVGKEVKSTIIADDGFLFGEVDLEQAETRDTAFITGEQSLIDAISCGRDFHSVNASDFFGVTYESIYNDELRKTLNKKLRDLSKRTNHGANYNMGDNVLVDTMGLERVWEAQRLLELPKNWKPKQVAQYLLAAFDKKYPRIRSSEVGGYHHYIKSVVETTKMLIGATGWSRYCFGNPKTNKSDLNSYVAHCPQSLNAMVLNKAFMRVFYEIALNKEHSSNFKLCAQIHDSIFFQFREGHEYLAIMVKERMEIPVKIKGIDGIEREFTVPAAIKAGEGGKGAKYWSDTEG